MGHRIVNAFHISESLSDPDWFYSLTSPSGFHRDIALSSISDGQQLKMKLS